MQPSVDVLRNLTAVRVHIDDCPVESGALRVVPGSHASGRLRPGEAGRLRDERGEQAVPVPRGGALLLRPLLLHASSKSFTAQSRRVLHFVFGPRHLPLELRWRLVV